ncbi:hypothetical protein BH23ACT12_BH23ACT12_09000 [soil metagenome]
MLALTAFAFIPAAIGMAIIRHRLFDIDLLVNRSLVYGLLTAGVIAVYTATVTALGNTLGERGQTSALVATGLVALLFQPARERLQKAVDRMLYGDRGDPYAALAGLARRLEGNVEPDAVLPCVVQTIAQSLRLPYAAIQLCDGEEFRTIAQVGRSAGKTVPLTLTHQGRTVGRLLLAPAGAEETFTAGERRLIEDLARQAGIAVYAVRLNDELKRSRERLVLAREEERRRLHRELHDGLGPSLAGLALQADVARDLIRRDPDKAEAMLGELKDQIASSVPEIRRLVYGLRPPALDELGLVAALQQQADQLSSNGRSGSFTATVEAEQPLAALPAATEVAAYRIVTEAITNAARHAGAHTCRVRLTMNGALEILVVDDGCGLPDGPQSGTGLRSMKERAAELGGQCAVGRRPEGGTEVRARLPMAGA